MTRSAGILSSATVPRYFVGDGTTSRYVSAADAPELTIDGSVRWSAYLRDDSTETTTSRMVVQKGTVGTTALAYRFGHSYLTGTSITGYPVGTPGTQIVVSTGGRTPLGLTPPGVDRYIRGVLTGVTPGWQNNTAQGQWFTSPDGVTWTAIGPPSTAVRGDAASFDDPNFLLVGLLFLGRIYWVQMEAINRAQLVFPGVTGNYLSVPAIALPGDFEMVTRLVVPSAGAIRTIVAQWRTNVPDRSFIFRITATSFAQLAIYPTGSSYTSTVALTPGATIWLKVTRVASTGLLRFYTASDAPTEPTTWTQLGADVTTVTGALQQPVQPGEIGTHTTGATDPFIGRIARVIIRNGIAGTTVLDVAENNAGTMTDATHFTATTGQPVTVTQTCKLVFPGTISNYISVPNAAPLNVAGDIEMVVRAAPTSWTPATTNVFMSKTFGAGNRSWYLMLNTNGVLTFNMSNDGTSNLNASSSVLGFAAGSIQWIKVTRVMSSGLVSFYSAADSPTEPTTWTAQGTATLFAGSAISSSTTPLFIGMQANNGNPMQGRISRAIVRNGIAGTVVLDVGDPNTTIPGQTSFNATTGGTVTVTQTAGNTIVQADPAVQIVQPQADRVVWRFDATEAPTSGTTYTDPRGRTWTMSAAGSIVPLP